MRLHIKILILIVFIVAFSLRLWKISSVPSSLSIDEVTFGYAGYSVLTTAHDEYGKFLPLFFQGVGDYKPPVDVYLNVITEKLFGLNEFAVRIHGVFLGSLTCVVLIFLLKEFGLKWRGSVFGGFWLAVSGWHIFFSRAGYESITALFFLSLGTFLFLKGLRLKKKLLLYISFISFSLSVWSYHAERIFVPVLFFFLIIYFKKKLLGIFKSKKDFIIGFLILGFFGIPFIYLLLFSKGISARAVNLWIGNAPHNGNIIEAFIGQYLNYFDLKFLFWDGLQMTPKGFQDVGIFSLIDIPLVVAGLYALTKKKRIKFMGLILFWLFLSPLPGAFARGDASPIRLLVAVPVFAYIIAVGFEKFKFKFIYLILTVLSLFYFFDVYTRLFPKYFADVWNYGYKEAAEYVCNNSSKYSKIIVTDKYGIELPNVKTVPNYYLLFYCKGISANIEIRQPQWRLDSKEKNWLLVGSRWDFPENFDKSRIMKTINFINSDKAAFYMVETDK